MITLDDTEARKTLAEIERDLSDAQIKRAHVRALNRAVVGARTELSREIRVRYAIKNRDVHDAVRIERANAGQAEPTATLVVSPQPIPLVRFGTPRQLRKGVSVTVVKGKRQVIRGAFVVESIAGNVFVRQSKARLPIKKLFGPSVRALAPQALENAEPRIKERVEEQIEHNINKLIEKAFK